MFQVNPLLQFLFGAFRVKAFVQIFNMTLKFNICKTKIYHILSIHIKHMCDTFKVPVLNI